MIDKLLGSCHDVSQLLSKSMDTRLNWVERIQMRLHFRVCTYCLQFEDQLKQIRAAGRSFEACEFDLESSDDLSEDAKNRLRQVIRDECR